MQVKSCHFTYPNVSMPKGACAYLRHPLIPPASIDMTGEPEEGRVSEGEMESELECVCVCVDVCVTEREIEKRKR